MHDHTGFWGFSISFPTELVPSFVYAIEEYRTVFGCILPDRFGREIERSRVCRYTNILKFECGGLQIFMVYNVDKTYSPKSMDLLKSTEILKNPCIKICQTLYGIKTIHGFNRIHGL